MRLVAVAPVAIAAAGCGNGVGRIGVADVRAAGSRELILGIEACHANARATVVSTSKEEIVVRVDGKRSSGGDACADGVTLCLAADLDGRAVLDDTSGRRFDILLSGTAPGRCAN